MRGEQKVVGSTDLRNRVGRMLDDALAGEGTIIERHGRRIAWVVPYNDMERMQRRLSRLEGALSSMLGPEWESRLGELDESLRAEPRLPESRSPWSGPPA